MQPSICANKKSSSYIQMTSYALQEHLSPRTNSHSMMPFHTLYTILSPSPTVSTLLSRYIMIYYRFIPACFASHNRTAGSWLGLVSYAQRLLRTSFSLPVWRMVLILRFSFVQTPIGNFCLQEWNLDMSRLLFAK
jgi:hypothetical protein